MVVKKVAQRAIAAGLAGMMSFGAMAPAALAIDNTPWVPAWWTSELVNDEDDLTYFRRISGDTRYDTMRAIVRTTYRVNGDRYWQCPTAVVASGDNFPDALAANGFAGALNGGEGAPLILTKKGALSSQAKDLLEKMQVQHVYIMGGTAAVSENVESAIRDLKITTTRVAGADRQATSAEAFRLIDGNWAKLHGTHSVIIATGANYADALSIAPFAYRTGTPVILTKADGTLTEEQVKYIKDNDEIWRVIIVGGTEAVSDSVISAIGTYNGKYNDYKGNFYITYRIAGADRYDTSAKIADWEVNEADKWLTVLDDGWAGFSFQWTFIATGENFPDALAGAQLAGGKWYTSARQVTPKPCSPILLTKDGNRAADYVIASNLAWNWSQVAANDREIYANWFDITTSPISNLYTGMPTTNIWNDIYDFITSYVVNGFFTVNPIVNGSGTGATDVFGNVNGSLVSSFDLYTLVGVESHDTTFSGIVFGGKQAVSKDKVKQLDDVVKDCIRKDIDGWGTGAMFGTSWDATKSLIEKIGNRYVYGTTAPTSYDGVPLSNWYMLNPTEAIRVNNTVVVGGDKINEQIIVPLRHYSFGVDPLSLATTWGFADDASCLVFDVTYNTSPNNNQVLSVSASFQDWNATYASLPTWLDANGTPRAWNQL